MICAGIIWIVDPYLNVKVFININTFVDSTLSGGTPQMYAEPTAEDRLSYQQISSSNFIRSAIVKQGLPSHASSTTVGEKVFQYYGEAKVIMIDHLQKKIKENCQLSLSFDEYTWKNRRYLTIKHRICFSLITIKTFYFFIYSLSKDIYSIQY